MGVDLFLFFTESIFQAQCVLRQHFYDRILVVVWSLKFPKRKFNFYSVLKSVKAIQED